MSSGFIRGKLTQDHSEPTDLEKVESDIECLLLELQLLKTDLFAAGLGERINENIALNGYRKEIEDRRNEMLKWKMAHHYALSAALNEIKTNKLRNRVLHVYNKTYDFHKPLKKVKDAPRPLDTPQE